MYMKQLQLSSFKLLRIAAKIFQELDQCAKVFDILKLKFGVRDEYFNVQDSDMVFLTEDQRGFRKYFNQAINKIE